MTGTFDGVHERPPDRRFSLLQLVHRRHQILLLTLAQTFEPTDELVGALDLPHEPIITF